MNIEESVRTFLDATGQSEVSEKVSDLRLAALEEDHNEFCEALTWGDPVFIAEKGADLVYDIVATFLSLGIPFTEVFAALQSSNMSRIGPDGTVQISEDTGKVLKGSAFQSAEEQIREILS